MSDSDDLLSRELRSSLPELLERGIRLQGLTQCHGPDSMHAIVCQAATACELTRVNSKGIDRLKRTKDDNLHRDKAVAHRSTKQ
jgi:hypothetical protein